MQETSTNIHVLGLVPFATLLPNQGHLLWEASMVLAINFEILLASAVLSVLVSFAVVTSSRGDWHRASRALLLCIPVLIGGIFDRPQPHRENCGAGSSCVVWCEPGRPWGVRWPSGTLDATGASVAIDVCPKNGDPKPWEPKLSFAVR